VTAVALDFGRVFLLLVMLAKLHVLEDVKAKKKIFEYE
jgi:hypothetical protein